MLVFALVDPLLRVISSKEIVLCICRVGPDPHTSNVRRHGRHVEDLEKSGGGKIRMRSRGLIVSLARMHRSVHPTQPNSHYCTQAMIRETKRVNDVFGYIPHYNIKKTLPTPYCLECWWSSGLSFPRAIAMYLGTEEYAHCSH